MAAPCRPQRPSIPRRADTSGTSPIPTATCGSSSTRSRAETAASVVAARYVVVRIVPAQRCSDDHAMQQRSVLAAVVIAIALAVVPVGAQAPGAAVADGRPVV